MQQIVNNLVSKTKEENEQYIESNIKFKKCKDYAVEHGCNNIVVVNGKSLVLDNLKIEKKFDITYYLCKECEKLLFVGYKNKIMPIREVNKLELNSNSEVDEGYYVLMPVGKNISNSINSFNLVTKSQLDEIKKGVKGTFFAFKIESMEIINNGNKRLY